MHGFLDTTIRAPVDGHRFAWKTKMLGFFLRAVTTYLVSFRPSSLQRVMSMDTRQLTEDIFIDIAYLISYTHMRGLSDMTRLSGKI